MKLTKAQKAAIRDWLKNYDGRHICPFESPKFDDDLPCDYLCPTMFPMLDRRRGMGDLRCPCDVYPLAYVRRVARRAIS